jgi:hypothetical protein
VEFPCLILSLSLLIISIVIVVDTTGQTQTDYNSISNTTGNTIDAYHS